MSLKVTKSKGFLLAITCGLCGCAQVRVDVSVYKGPIKDSIDGRLAKGVGLAQSLRDVARNVSTSKYAVGADKELLLQLVDGYESANIDKLYLEYDTFGKEPEYGRTHEGQPITAAEKAERKKLARRPVLRALAAFSDRAQANAEKVAIPMLRELILWPPKEKAVFFTGLVTIDEIGKIVNTIVNSILAEEMINESALAEKQEHSEDNKKQKGSEPPKDKEIFLSRINHIMASQSPGTLITLMKELPRYNAIIDRTYSQRYWGEINSIKVDATGDSVMLLAKDETGNWHLKAAKVDPTEVIAAARDVAEMGLRMIAAAYGIAAPKSVE